MIFRAVNLLWCVRDIHPLASTIGILCLGKDPGKWRRDYFDGQHIKLISSS